MRCISGSPNCSMTVLSSSVSAPSMVSSSFSRGRAPGRAPAAGTFERAADGHHANVHGAFAQCRSQPFDFLGDGGDLGVIALVRKLAEPRLHRHQLSDQVHKLVQLGRRHAQTRSLVRLVVAAAARRSAAAIFESPRRLLCVRGGQVRVTAGAGSLAAAMLNSTRVFDKMKNIANRLPARNRGQVHLHQT